MLSNSIDRFLVLIRLVKRNVKAQINAPKLSNKIAISPLSVYEQNVLLLASCLTITALNPNKKPNMNNGIFV